MKRRELTFKVFVSSTFSDFRAERRALQDEVFPRLRAFCEARNARFQPVDLRWGVSEEAALDQQTMTICLDELHRCQTVSPKPNFIVLLGQRYGWIPLPARIPGEDFGDLLEAIPEGDDRDILWKDDQVVDAWAVGGKNLRTGWYRKDANAVPPVYVLQPRRLDESTCATDNDRQRLRCDESEDWKQSERRMLAILSRAADTLGWPVDDGRRLLFEKSATHQEIDHGAFDVADADRHVFGYIRKIHFGKSDIADGTDIEEFAETDSKALERLADLESQIRNRIPSNIQDLPSTWDPHALRIDDPQGRKGQPIGHLEAFCAAVEADLKKVIEAEIAAYGELPLEVREREAHREFGIERSSVFHGREDFLRAARDYLEDSTQCLPLVLIGESGCGKSAMMAKLIGDMGGFSSDAANAGIRLIYRFIGATPESSSLHALLTGLLREFGIADIPQDIREIKTVFRNQLTKAEPAGQKIILFLDALDQLGNADDAAMLDWLPSKLGPGWKLVISALASDDIEGACCRKAQELWSRNCIHIGPLEGDAVKAALDDWLKNAGRKLTEFQNEYLLRQAADVGNPLYMKLAFERARCWTHHVTTPELADSTEGLIEKMLAELEQERRHGRVLVERALALIAASKQGLAESELLDLLSADNVVMEDFRRRSPESPPVSRLPGIVWSRLFADLRPYMTHRRVDGTIVLGFYHRQVGAMAVKRYLIPSQGCDAHRKLLNYYNACWRDIPDPCNPVSVRAAKGIAYHAWRCLPHSSDELADTVLRPELFDAWAESGYVHELLNDVDGGVSLHPLINKFLRAWGGHTVWLMRFPDLACQTLHSVMIGQSDADVLLSRLERYLLNRTRASKRYCLRYDVGNSSDYRYSYSISGPPLVKPPFGRSHYFFENGSLISAFRLSAGQTKTYEISAKGITKVAASDDGNFIATGYNLRQPRWIVFDQAGRRLGDASMYPEQQDDEPLALAFIDGKTLSLLTHQAFRLIGLPSCNTLFEYHDPCFQRASLAIVTAEDDGATIAIISKDARGYVVKVLRLNRDVVGNTVQWSIEPVCEHLFELRVAHVACCDRFVAVATQDRKLHFLLTSLEANVANRVYALPRRPLRGICCDSRSVYYTVLNEPFVFRLDTDDGSVTVARERDNPTGEIHAAEEGVFVLTGNHADQLVFIAPDAFGPPSSTGSETASGHVVLPTPAQRISTSPSGACQVLVCSTPTVGVFRLDKHVEWITPSTAQIVDAAVSDAGVVYMLDSEGRVYRADPPYRSDRNLFSAPVGDKTRLFLLRDAIAVMRRMDTSFVEIAFFSLDGEMLGKWSNRNLANVTCCSFYDAKASVHGTLHVLFRAERHQASMPLRRIELNVEGTVLSDRTATLDASPMAQFVMARDDVIVWDREHLHLLNVASSMCTPLKGWDSRIGDICRVEVSPRVDKLILYGKYGIQVAGFVSNAPTFLLPGNGMTDRIVMLGDDRLCRVRSMIHQEMFTIT